MRFDHFRIEVGGKLYRQDDINSSQVHQPWKESSNKQQKHNDFTCIKNTETVLYLDVMQIQFPTVHLPNYHNESFA